MTSSGVPAGATLSRNDSSRRMKSWNTAATRAPRRKIELAQVDAVDLDRARLRIVQAAEQVGDRRLPRAVLPDDQRLAVGGALPHLPRKRASSVEHALA